MELEIPKAEIIENIYKDKPPNINNWKSKHLNIRKSVNDYKENDLISKSGSNSSNKDKKRRQGFYVTNVFKKKEEEKEDNSNNLSQDDISKEEIKVKQKKKNILSIISNIFSAYISFQTSYIIALINVFLSLCYYDLRLLLIPAKYKQISRTVYYFLLFYISFDFIIRAINTEKLIKNFYFWFDLLTFIIMIFDIDSVSYPLLSRIIHGKVKTKYISYQHQKQIENILHIFQIVKLFRVVKLYKLFVDLIKEKEKKNYLTKILSKINDKRMKNTRSKVSKYSRQSLTVFKDSNNNNNNNNTTSMAFSSNPNNIDLINKRNLKKIPKYSIYSKKKKKKEEERIKFIKQHLFKRNKINQKITEGISSLMIIIVLLVFIVSVFTDEDNFNYSFSYCLMCKYINNYVKSKEIKDKSLIISFVNKYLFTNILNIFPIIQIEYNDTIIYQNKSMNLNLNEYMKRDISYIYDINDTSTIIIISTREISKMTSFIFLIRLFYIVIIVSCLCCLINKKVHKLIFHPLEKIDKILDLISKDPVGSKTIEELKNNMKNNKINKNEDINSVNHEIKIIQNAIIRISTLMAIVFGEAGGEILKENISSSEGVNPMLPGKKISAIFGFCFIHHFSEINEVFQEKTMIFVNQISDIVHSCTDKFNGITNKNLGDCYLLAWKFKDKKDNNNNNNNNILNNNNTLNIVQNSTSNNNITNNNNNVNNNNHNIYNNNLSSINLNNNNDESYNKFIININDLKTSLVNDSEMTLNKKEEMSDCALLGFLNIIKKINKSQNILSYKKDPILLKKFGTKFSVQMGFGLHTGWGIEGAIGSYYKIDCSYLSPNVNIAARLETATNIYGVDILFSGEFYDLLSDFMKSLCRKIDIVTLKGSEKPISLYTVDINKNIHPGKIFSKKDKMTLRERRSYYAFKKKKLWNKFSKVKNSSSIGEVYLKQSKGLKELLRKSKSDMFYQYFEDGLSDYIDGEWKDAAINLEKARYLEKSDGPTKTILDYIKSLNYKAPNNWDGYRVLTSKT